MKVTVKVSFFPLKLKVYVHSFNSGELFGPHGNLVCFVHLMCIYNVSVSNGFDYLFLSGVTCFKFYNSMAKFSGQQIHDIFLIFPSRLCHFMQNDS